MRSEIIPTNAVGADTAPYDPTIAAEANMPPPETDTEAAQQGPDDNWKFWQAQISAALVHERRWRGEAEHAESVYFGPDTDEGETSPRVIAAQNVINEKTMLVKGTMDVLIPIMYSATPNPIVSRRFKGDGKKDATANMAAEAAQRIASFLVETERFDKPMRNAVRDYVIVGRGAARVHYSATFRTVQVVNPITGVMEPRDEKSTETVRPVAVDWQRLLCAPASSWESTPWIAFETPMTRKQVADRFDEPDLETPLEDMAGQEVEKPRKISEMMTYNKAGLSGYGKAISDRDRDGSGGLGFIGNDETSTPTISPFDSTTVWEIWNKDSREVIWWSPYYKHGILDKVADPLELEDFWPTPEPLTTTARGQTLTPRPDMRYYEMRAEEAEEAAKKIRSILKAISVSGFFPGNMQDEMKKLLDGQNVMIAIADWVALMDKAGTRGIVQWLPIDIMIQAVQALLQIREAAKAAMFEGSGVSDLMRAQGDPNETLGAQQMKGRYANLRMADRQKDVAEYARDLIRLMTEVSVEHFDTAYIADICEIDLPMTEAERLQIVAQQQQAMAAWQQQTQALQTAAQAGVPNLPPPPPEPKFDDVPETSWEAVHARLRSDLSRKIMITIETDSTVLADEQADKEARVEFISVMGQFVQTMLPMVQSGAFDLKVMKELLLFGVRGFPKSRTLEGMISSLPDEAPQGDAQQEDVAVTVAKIRAEVDLKIEEMKMQDAEAARQHDEKMKTIGHAVDVVNSMPDPQQPQA